MHRVLASLYELRQPLMAIIGLVCRRGFWCRWSWCSCSLALDGVKVQSPIRVARALVDAWAMLVARPQ